jgi:hypothetical protein
MVLRIYYDSLMRIYFCRTIKVTANLCKFNVTLKSFIVIQNLVYLSSVLSDISGSFCNSSAMLLVVECAERGLV